MRRGLIVAIALGLAAMGPRVAVARRGVRPHFEPTDLELEEPGMIELDAQAGLVRGPAAGRLVAPDFEVDIGVTRNLEIDVDGAYAVEASEPDTPRLDTWAPDSLWICGKLGLFDWADEGSAPEALDAWAVGTQVGPKLPVVPGSHGLGIEALVLLGHVMGKAHFALNVGGFTDPHPAASAGRPVGFEAGVDFDRDLDAGGRFQVVAQLAGVRFASHDPNQLVATAGLGWAVTPATQLGVTGLWGFLAGNDRYGALVGFSQKMRFLGHP